MKLCGNLCGSLIPLSTVFLLSGCATLAPANSATPLPDDFLPTAIALTVQAVITPLPAPTQSTPTDTAISSTPVETSEPTLSPEQPVVPNVIDTPDTALIYAPVTTPPAPLPTAAVQILSPGPASRVTSPLRVNAYLSPGAKGNVRLELLGEDGRLLVRKLLSYGVLSRVQVFSELDFGISAAGELGRLQFVTEDEYERTIAVASVDLLLLSLGESDINPPGDLLDRIIILEPARNSLIQGGSVRVTGFARLAGEQKIWVELITGENKVVGYRQVMVAEPQETGHAAFEVDIPYTISETTWVRLSISHKDGRIPGVTHLTSTEVLLSP